MKEGKEYFIQARRHPLECWSAWTNTTDPNKAEEYLAYVQSAGYEGRIVERTIREA